MLLELLAQFLYLVGWFISLLVKVTFMPKRSHFKLLYSEMQGKLIIIVVGNGFQDQLIIEHFIVLQNLLVLSIRLVLRKVDVKGLAVNFYFYVFIPVD